MKYIAVFTIVAVLAVSIDAQRRRTQKNNGRGRCRADTSLTEKSLNRNAIRQVEQQVSQTLGVQRTDVSVKNVQFNSYCGCTQLTFEMPQSVIQSFQSMVNKGSFRIQLNQQPVYVNALTILSGSGASSSSSGTSTFKTVKVATSVTSEIRLSKAMIEQLQVQLSEAMSSQTGSTASFVIRSVDFDTSCSCTTVTLTTSSQLVQVLQSLIQNGYSINVNGNSIALTSLTVLSTSSGGKTSSSSNSVQSNVLYGVVETSLSDAAITQAQASQIVNQVQESLGVRGSETPEIKISQIAFESSCACTAITFEMSPSLMTQFQSMVSNGYSVTVGGRSIAFYSLAVMQIVDGQMVVSTPSSGGGFCFSGDSEVLTPGGYVKMQDLGDHDRVAVMKSTNELRFEPVWWFIHKEPNTEAEFKVIETEMGNRIEMTGKHLIPQVPCDINLDGVDMDQVFKEYSVFAEEVVPGSCVMSMVKGHKVAIQKVESVGTVQKTGIYSPLTNSGTILVDDIAASCYSHLRSHSIQHTIFILLRKMTHMFSSDAFVSNLGGNLPKLLNVLHHAGMWLTSA